MDVISVHTLWGEKKSANKHPPVSVASVGAANVFSSKKEGWKLR